MNPEREDTFIEEHIETEHVERDRELEQLRAVFLERYPTPHSAVDDVREGIVTIEELRVRFSEEEIVVIREDVTEDREIPSGTDLL